MSARVPLSFITGTSPVALLGRGNDAGFVGAHTLDALGYDTEKQRVYLLEHFEDESGDLPQLHFMHTHGHHMGRLIPVRTWYSGDAAEVEEKFEARLAELASGLRPLRPLSLDDLVLSTRVVRRRALRLYPDLPPIRKYELRLTVRPFHRDVVSSFGGRALVTAYLRPRARLIEAYRIPGERLALAIASYIGIPFELGYEKNAALLVPFP
jgi:hypothetical protein